MVELSSVAWKVYYYHRNGNLRSSSKINLLFDREGKIVGQGVDSIFGMFHVWGERDIANNGFHLHQQLESRASSARRGEGMKKYAYLYCVTLC